MKLVDLSHAIEHGMVTYRGLPAPAIRDFWTREASRAHYAPGTEFHIGRIDMAANTGTYVDAPFRRLAGGKDVAGLPLESPADLEGVVVQTDSPAIPAAAFDGLEVRGKAVPLETGWSRDWGATSDPTRPAHTILLGAGIPIREHMCTLASLPAAGFRFSAVPGKVRGLGSFPVRAYAAVEE